MLANKLSFLEDRVQLKLFPIIEDQVGEPLLEGHCKVIRTLETLKVESLVPQYTPFSRGRPPKNPQAVARALVAQHVLGISSVDHLIQRLKVDKHLRYICGWQPSEKIPSESTFSRMFAWLSQEGLLDQVHAELVSEVFEEHVVLHCGRDSCPIEVRERKNGSKGLQKTERRAYRSAEGKKLTACEYQATEAKELSSMLATLPTDCDIGKKTDAHGISKCWRGYKLHLDVAEGCFPISCVVTSASTHDSQAAIPLSVKSSSRATVLYELMDSAYDVNAITNFISSQGRVPITKKHKRRGKRKEDVEANEAAHKALNWCPASERRAQHRFTNERMFARLKDSFLSSKIYYRGHLKVSARVLLGVLCLCASEITNLLC